MPSVASTPKSTPQRMIETTCQKATTLRFAPNPTIADDVICEGRNVWPSSETPGTPNLSNMRLRRCRFGFSSVCLPFVARSEERRVGKDCSARCLLCHDRMRIAEDAVALDVGEHCS